MVSSFYAAIALLSLALLVIYGARCLLNQRWPDPFKVFEIAGHSGVFVAGVRLVLLAAVLCVEPEDGTHAESVKLPSGTVFLWRIPLAKELYVTLKTDLRNLDKEDGVNFAVGGIMTAVLAAGLLKRAVLVPMSKRAPTPAE